MATNISVISDASADKGKTFGGIKIETPQQYKKRKRTSGSSATKISVVSDAPQDVGKTFGGTQIQTPQQYAQTSSGQALQQAQVNKIITDIYNNPNILLTNKQLNSQGFNMQQIAEIGRIQDRAKRQKLYEQKVATDNLSFKKYEEKLREKGIVADREIYDEAQRINKLRPTLAKSVEFFTPDKKPLPDYVKQLKNINVPQSTFQKLQSQSTTTPEIREYLKEQSKPVTVSFKLLTQEEKRFLKGESIIVLGDKSFILDKNKQIRNFTAKEKEELKSNEVLINPLRFIAGIGGAGISTYVLAKNPSLIVKGIKTFVNSPISTTVNISKGIQESLTKDPFYFMGELYGFNKIGEAASVGVKKIGKIKVFEDDLLIKVRENIRKLEDAKVSVRTRGILGDQLRILKAQEQVLLKLRTLTAPIQDLKFEINKLGKELDKATTIKQKKILTTKIAKLQVINNKLVNRRVAFANTPKVQKLKKVLTNREIAQGLNQLFKTSRQNIIYYTTKYKPIKQTKIKKFDSVKKEIDYLKSQNNILLEKAKKSTNRIEKRELGKKIGRNVFKIKQLENSIKTSPVKQKTLNINELKLQILKNKEKLNPTEFKRYTNKIKQLGFTFTFEKGVVILKKSEVAIISKKKPKLLTLQKKTATIKLSQFLNPKVLKMYQNEILKGKKLTSITKEEITKLLSIGKTETLKLRLKDIDKQINQLKILKDEYIGRAKKFKLEVGKRGELPKTIGRLVGDMVNTIKTLELKKRQLIELSKKTKSIDEKLFLKRQKEFGGKFNKNPQIAESVRDKANYYTFKFGDVQIQIEFNKSTSSLRTDKKGRLQSPISIKISRTTKLKYNNIVDKFSSNLKKQTQKDRYIFDYFRTFDKIKKLNKQIDNLKTFDSIKKRKLKQDLFKMEKIVSQASKFRLLTLIGLIQLKDFKSPKIQIKDIQQKLSSIDAAINKFQLKRQNIDINKPVKPKEDGRRVPPPTRVPKPKEDGRVPPPPYKPKLPKPEPPKPPVLPKRKFKISPNSKKLENKILTYRGIYRERKNPNLPAGTRNPIVTKSITIRDTKNRALQRVAQRVDTSLVRSMQLQVMGIGKYKRDIQKPTILNKFRMKKSKNTPVLSLVEKAKYLLDAKREKMESLRAKLRIKSMGRVKKSSKNGYKHLKRHR